MNPNGLLYHIWTGLLTLGFLYNALSTWMLVFYEFRRDFFVHWLVLNAVSDALNLLDLGVQAKKAFLHDGILITKTSHTLRHYIFSRHFLFDFVAVLPTDILLLCWPQLSPLRINRLAKVNRVREFIQLTEHRAPWPLGFRLFRLATICYLLFHWNASFYFWLSTVYGYENATFDDWTFSYMKIPDLIYPICDPRFDEHRNVCLYPERNWRDRPKLLAELRAHWERKTGTTQFGNLTKKYAMSFYWSALTLVTLGEQPWPVNSVQMVFEIVDTLIGLLVFAAIIGDIGIMVSSAHSAKANFQEFVDGCKRYMSIRNVNDSVRERVVNWIEYQWIWGERGEATDEIELLRLLPPRLALELAAETHVPALLGSPVFCLCEHALLSELAIRLQSRRFGPGDIVCRRGEIAKEFFIVKHGRLEMLLEEDYSCNDEDSSGNRSISPRLMLGMNEPNRYLIEGDNYGDWALLGECRIPYTVRSIGYSCLLTLTRESMAAAFEDYPHCRRMVRRKANLLRQRHEERWTSRTNSSKRSFDSEEFLFQKHATTVPRTPRRASAIFDDGDEEETAEFGDHQHSSLETRLYEIQKAVQAITTEVEAAEKSFVSSSSNLKRWVSTLEREYQEQRPRLKKFLKRPIRRRKAESLSDIESEDD